MLTAGVIIHVHLLKSCLSAVTTHAGTGLSPAFICLTIYLLNISKMTQLGSPNLA